MRVYRERGGLYEVATYYTLSLSNRGRLMRRDDKNYLANLATRRLPSIRPSTLGQETTSKCRFGALKLVMAKHYYANLGRPSECLDGLEEFPNKKAMETGALKPQCRERLPWSKAKGNGMYKGNHVGMPYHGRGDAVCCCFCCCVGWLEYPTLRLP